jgi:hypothetical protein
VTLASLLIFHRGSYNNNSPGTFRYHLVVVEWNKQKNSDIEVWLKIFRKENTPKTG